jgi:hypothetical protein
MVGQALSPARRNRAAQMIQASDSHTAERLEESLNSANPAETNLSMYAARAL